MSESLQHFKSSSGIKLVVLMKEKFPDSREKFLSIFHPFLYSVLLNSSFCSKQGEN